MRRKQFDTAASVHPAVKQSDTASSNIGVLIVSGQLPLEQVCAILAAVENAISRKLSVTLLNPKELQQRLDNSPFLTKVGIVCCSPRPRFHQKWTPHKALQEAVTTAVAWTDMVSSEVQPTVTTVQLFTL